MKENHEITPSQEAFRRGSTRYHARKTLTAKAILAEIRRHPGQCREDILAAIGETSGHGGFESLQRLKLAHFVRGEPAVWYPTKT